MAALEGERQVIVRLIASTVVTGWDDMRQAGWVKNRDDPNFCPTYSDSDLLAEFAGRLCYQSWDRPNPATAMNVGYLANILSQEHFSVLEHSSATFYVAEVSRSLSHELVRHRHLSFSQLSQRFIDEENAMAVVPPAIEMFDAEYKNGLGLTKIVGVLMHEANYAYERLVAQLVSAGYTRKQAREAARCVLPNATETKFVVTGNLRAWRDVLKRRLAPAADAEMQLFAREVLKLLLDLAPNTFQDMKEDG